MIHLYVLIEIIYARTWFFQLFYILLLLLCVICINACASVRMFMGFLCYLVFHFVVDDFICCTRFGNGEQRYHTKIAFICRARKTSRMWTYFYTEFGPSIVFYSHCSFLSFHAQNNSLIPYFFSRCACTAFFFDLS